MEAVKKNLNSDIEEYKKKYEAEAKGLFYQKFKHILEREILASKQEAAELEARLPYLPHF